MGTRRLLMLMSIAWLALVPLAAGWPALAQTPPPVPTLVSWADAGHLPPIAPARPKPVEPDAPDSGPFHALAPVPAPAPAPAARPGPRVFFSHAGGALKDILARLGAARESIRVLGYSFTSEPIARALVAARARGVDVRVVLDRSQPTTRGNRIAILQAGGVPVTIDYEHRIMHEKVIILDGADTLTGSYNWSDSAEYLNAENLRWEPADPLAPEYLADWRRHEAHARPAPARPARVSSVPSPPVPPDPFPSPSPVPSPPGPSPSPSPSPSPTSGPATLGAIQQAVEQTFGPEARPIFRDAVEQTFGPGTGTLLSPRPAVEPGRYLMPPPSAYAPPPPSAYADTYSYAAPAYCPPGRT